MSCPPHVGKYPNSIAIGCYKQIYIKDDYPYKKGQGRIVFTYVSKDEPEYIYNFYKDKLLKHFEDIRLNFPEKSWRLAIGGYPGIQIHHVGIDTVDNIYNWEDFAKELFRTTSITERESLASKGGIFNIKIFRGVSDVESLIQGYSWIDVYYDVEPDVIKEKIKRYSKEKEK